MTDKLEILKKIMPVAVLEAMSPATIQAVSQSVLVDGMVPLRCFPFRVGRQSRVKIIDGRVERIERVTSDSATPNNDLYLVDNGPQLNVSREHFQIEKEGDRFYLYDRNSDCGTFVEEKQVGGSNNEMTVEIKDGDVITVGTKQSPYIFRFVVLDGFELRLKK